MAHEQHTVRSPLGRYPLDIAGVRIARLTAIRFVRRSPRGQAYWECRCDCGNLVEVRRDSLLRETQRSCGCLAAEDRLARATRHGACASGRSNGDPTYVTWKSMRQRCRDPNSDQYWRYGGAGVKVCDRWQDFCAFLADMGPRPPGMTIDRIDPYGDYEPGNCRWVDWSTQNRNKREHHRSVAVGS